MKIIRKTEVIILLRNKSYFDYFKWEVLSVLLFTIFYILLYIVCSGIIGFLNLTGEVEFTTIPLEFLNFGDIYSTVFSNSFLALIGITLFMISGLMFLAIIILFLNIFFTRKIIILYIFFIYGSMLLGTNQGDLNRAYPYIFLNNYIILSHAIDKDIINMILGIIAIAITLIFYLVKKGWRVKRYV